MPTSSDGIAALFFERFKDDKHYDTGTSLVRKKWITARQAKWLSDVWFRENRDAVTERNFGGKGSFSIGDTVFGWSLWLSPNGSGMLEVREIKSEKDWPPGFIK